MKVTLLKITAIVALFGLGTSCKKDVDTIDSSESNGYITLLRTGNPSTDYLLTVTDLLSGSISSTAKGIEQQGWCYSAKAGDTYLTFDYTNNIARGYKIQNGALTESGQFAFERMDCMNEEGDQNTLIGIGAPWGGGSYDCKIQIIDGSSVSISKSVNSPIYTTYYNGKQLNAWPTNSYVQDNKMYVTFYPLVGDTWETPITDTAYVSVYSYPDLVYQTTFKDTRTGPIGYYSSQPCVLKDESGNHFTISNTSNAAGFTQSTKPAGILKINSGQSQFDANYFFNTEALGYKVLGGAYAGNGKVVARVISLENDKAVPSWAAFSVTEAPILNIAILDLNTQTITVVNGVPLHGGQYLTPFLVEDGKVYTSITTSTSDSFIYQIDPSTATAVKGARIEGTEIQALFKY